MATAGNLGQRPDKAIGLDKPVSHRLKAEVCFLQTCGLFPRIFRPAKRPSLRRIPSAPCAALRTFEPLVDGHDLILARSTVAPQVSRDVLAWAEVSPILGKDRERSRYSWAGICCSISRQALTLRRRQTQQSGSVDPIVVSAPQTEHKTTFFRRSVEIDCFACSRIWGGMTGSGFGCILRLMFPVLFSLLQK